MVRLLLVLTVLGCALAVRAPVPYCNSRPIYKEGPLAYEERITHDMDTAFSGYNLDIQLASNSTCASLTKKFTQEDNMGSYFPGLISHHIEHSGNDWGKEYFLLYKDKSNNTQFVYGLMQDTHHVPQVDFTLQVTHDSAERCFGGAMFLDYGIAIIDCLRTTDNGLQNFFVYLDLANHNITKRVDNAMFVRFSEVRQRKTYRFKDPITSYVYLLRAYEAEGVDMHHADNTYMEIFSAKDPSDLQLLRVVDRTFVHAKTMSIVDVKVYLGDIFMLDFLNGLYRLDILRNQDIAVMARYNKEGFTKFGVYSDDLENEVIIALANAHAVYEIDWADTIDPVTLNKYSLVEHSHIRSVNLNDRYLIVQSAANVTNDDNKEIELDYTWVFTKGSRTYMNAYHIINHNSSRVEISFNSRRDQILIADEAGLTLFKVAEARIYLQLAEKSKVGQSEEVVLIATSSDPNSKDTFKCQEKFTIHFVEKEDQSIYDTGIETTTQYSSNYPGELHIPLLNYKRGPNMTYSLTNTSSKHETPAYWFDHINQTKILKDFADYNGIIFFHTQVVPKFGEENILYYIQDSEYQTHVVSCIHVWEYAEAYCSEASKYNHTSKIISFATAYFEDQEDWNYFFIIVFQDDRKTLQIIDFGRQERLVNITYSGQQEAEITDIATSNGYLYVLRGAVKTIDVYMLSKCQEEKSCKPDFKIDAETLKPLGVDYFAPIKLVTDFMHPEVLFIECRGSILIIDIDNKERMTLLDEIVSPATTNQFYRITVNQNTMVVVSNPNIIDVYSLENIYSRNEVRYMRRLPIYDYEIQAVADVEFSDVEDLIYINAVDPKQSKSVILMYRPNSPSALSLFKTMTLPRIYSRPDLEIEVSGFICDFLSIKTDHDFELFRVFEYPMLAIKDTFLDFKFQIQFENPKTKLTSENLQIQTVNYPDGFDPTPELNKTIDNLKLSSTGNYTWNDRKWFTGHILSYNYSCKECGDKVKIRQHVQKTGELHVSGFDFAETLTGSIVLNQDLIKFHINGSIHEILLLPDQKSLERCQRVATTYFSDFVVSGCQERGRGVNLYVTTTTSFKSWTWGPYRSSAFNVRTLQVEGALLMLTDTSEYPEYRFDKGGVYLYYIGFDRFSGEEMEELEFIDENDFVNSHGYDKDYAYIANSHLVFDSINNVYRLYLTEIDSGLFVIDFTYKPGRFEINIVKTSFIDVKALLEKNNLHMPYDASFQAVTRVAYKYSPHFEQETVLVTTKNYDNFEILLTYGEDGNILAANLHRVYYRYAYYTAVNSVKAVYGYVAMSYILPPIYQEFTEYTRQIVAVYDSYDYESDAEKGYSERYMLGAFRSNRTTPLVFAFNTTYDRHSNGTRNGLIVTSPFDSPSKNMYELSLSRNLTAQLKSDFDSQTLTFIPYNDFDTKKFSIELVNQFGDEDMLVIIILVLAGLIVIGFTIYVCILIKNKRKNNRNQQNLPEERTSLLTDGALRETLIQPEDKLQSIKDNEPKIIREDEQHEEDEESGESSEEVDDNEEQVDDKKEGEDKNEEKEEVDDKEDKKEGEEQDKKEGEEEEVEDKQGKE